MERTPAKYRRRCTRLRRELARQREMVLKVSERLYICSTQLSKVSERKDVRGKP